MRIDVGSGTVTVRAARAEPVVLLGALKPSAFTPGRRHDVSELLTPDRIASLVEAAKHGELPEPNTGQRRPHRVRMVDFSRPTKFTTEQQRRITRAAETFCQTANTRLSAELRIPIEFEVLNTVQLTWAAAQNQLPPGTLSALIDVEPIGTRMLFAAEQSFVLVCLEALLGGSPERPRVIAG